MQTFLFKKLVRCWATRFCWMQDQKRFTGQRNERERRLRWG